MKIPKLITLERLSCSPPVLKPKNNPQNHHSIEWNL